MSEQVWDILGVEAGSDERAIKRAYARRLKNTRPEDDPEGFKQLRWAYECAMYWAAQDLEEAAAGDGSATGGTQEDVQRTQAAEELPPAADPAPDPFVEARALWASVEPTLPVQTRQRLDAVSRSDAMLSLEVRDAFEICALEYAAGSACPETVREELVGFYGWDHQSAYIARQAPDAYSATMARHRATQSFELLRSHIKNPLVVDAITADTVPAQQSRIVDAGFVIDMRELLDTLRDHYPEVSYYLLNEDVIAYWEAEVAKRRYYYQTGIFSFVVGLVLWFGFGWLSDDFNVDFSEWKWEALLGSQAVSFAAIGLATFYLPDNLAPSWPNIGSWIADLWNRRRFQPMAQLGWIPGLALGSVLLCVPEPPVLLQYATGTLLSISLVWALYACSVFMNPWGPVVAVACGLVIASFMSRGVAYPYLTCVPASTMMLLLAWRGGEDLISMLDIGQGAVKKARYAWLVGASVLAYSLADEAAPPAYLVAAVWLWYLAGLLLSRGVVSTRMMWFGAVAVIYIIRTGALLPGGPLIQLLVAATAIAAAFMILHLVREDEYQQSTS